MDVLNIQSPGAIERANPEGVKHMDVLNKMDFSSLRSVKSDRLPGQRHGQTPGHMPMKQAALPKPKC